MTIRLLTALLLFCGTPVGSVAFAQQGAASDTDALAELGRMIFFDSRVSSDNTTSCSSCHQEARAWTDGRVLNVGRIGNAQTPNGRIGTRNTPHIVNSSLTEEQFRDLRASSPHDQATQPMENPQEMGDQNVGQVANRLSGIPGYQALSQKAFGSPGLNRARMAAALVAFQRTFLVAKDTPLSRYLEGRKDHGMSQSAQRGADLFKTLQCIECHPAPLFTTGKAANNGWAYYFSGGNLNVADPGLAQTTNNADHARAFKIPSLVNLSARASQPLGHAGQIKKIDDVIALYNEGAAFIRNGQRESDPLLDPRVKQRKLSYEQFQDLKACLLEGTIPFDLPRNVTPTVEQLPK